MTAISRTIYIIYLIHIYIYIKNYMEKLKPTLVPMICVACQMSAPPDPSTTPFHLSSVLGDSL